MIPRPLLVSGVAAYEVAVPLDGLLVGVRLPVQGLKIVTQPYHSRVVITAVPDDVAAAFDCESRLMLGDASKTPRAYGNYFGATFFIKGSQDQPVSLLWGRENGYWTEPHASVNRDFTRVAYTSNWDVSTGTDVGTP